MELLLLGCEGAPDRGHPVIAINSRPTRQTLLCGPCNEPFTLRKWPWPLKIELFARLGKTLPGASVAELDVNGCCTVDFASYDNRPMSVTFHVVDNPNAVMHEPKPELEPNVNKYFEEHGLNEFMRENFDLLIQQRPDDPYDFLAQRFREAAAQESHEGGNLSKRLNRKAEAEETGFAPLDKSLPPIVEAEEGLLSVRTHEEPSPVRMPRPELESEDDDFSCGQAKAAHTVLAPPQDVTTRQRAKALLEASDEPTVLKALLKAQQTSPRRRARNLLADTSIECVEKALAHSSKEPSPVRMLRPELEGEDDDSSCGQAKAAHTVLAPPQDVTTRQRAKALLEASDEPTVLKALLKAQQTSPRRRARNLLADTSVECVEKALANSSKDMPSAHGSAEQCKALPAQARVADVADGSLQDSAAAQKAAADREEIARLAAAQAERVEAAEKAAAAAQAAAEKAEADRREAERLAAAEKAAAEKAAADRREMERLAAERAAAEKAAADREEIERLAAAQRAAAERAEADRREVERLAAAERAATEKAIADKREAERLQAAERAAAEKASADRREAERLAAAELESSIAELHLGAERAAAEKAQRLAAAEKAAADKVAADRAELERLAAEKAVAAEANADVGNIDSSAAKSLPPVLHRPVFEEVEPPAAKSLPLVIHRPVFEADDEEKAAKSTPLPAPDPIRVVAGRDTMVKAVVSERSVPHILQNAANSPSRHVPTGGGLLHDEEPNKKQVVSPISISNAAFEPFVSEYKPMMNPVSSAGMQPAQYEQMLQRLSQHEETILRIKQEALHNQMIQQGMDDRSLPLTQHVHDENMDGTPRLSQFVPTEASTADTPRLSQFCPDVLSNFQSAPRSEVTTVYDDDESPCHSKFMPSIFGDAGRGMMPDVEKGTPRLTDFVPSHMQSSPLSSTPGMLQMELPGGYLATSSSSAGATPRLSQFMPDAAEVHRSMPVPFGEISRFSSYTPMGASRDMNSDVTVDDDFLTEPLNLDHCVPAELASWKRDIVTPPECTPRLTQFVPHLAS